LSQHRNTCAVARKNTPKLLQRLKEKIAQRNEKVLNKDYLQTIGDNIDVDHFDDQVRVLIICLMKIEFLLFKAEAMNRGMRAESFT
jgi:hypothetical protein